MKKSRLKFLYLACLFVSLTGMSKAGLSAQTIIYNGWTLTQNDPAYNLFVLGKMAEFGVTHVQLSHNIISRVDQLEADSVAERVKTLADVIHENNGNVIVWAQELPYDTRTFDFDLDSGDMQARMAAYRYALTRVPGIDGVMISFGSAPTELDDVNPAGDHAADYAQAKERYKVMIEAVSQVVEDEFGKQVYVRTFYHTPDEVDGLRLAMQETDRPVIVMSKSEPNDFEPYYPLNPLIGDVGDHPQILELDAAGEYWGQSKIPFVAGEYYKLRFWQTNNKTEAGGGSFIGSTCRIDRYSHPAMGTLNEANIYVQTYLLNHPEAGWKDALAGLFKTGTGFFPGSQAFDTFLDILRRTYWIGKKMYYVKGEWAFTKGSVLPDSESAALGLMLNKSIMKWNSAYSSVFLDLLLPSPQVIREILQEKMEGIELADRNLEALQLLEPDLDQDDFLQLYTLLVKQKKAAQIWYQTAGAIFSRRCANTSPDPGDAAAWAKWHLRSLRKLSAQLKSRAEPLITDYYPFDPSDITTLVKNSRSSLTAETKMFQPDWLEINDIRLLDTTAQSASISWDAREGVIYQVEVTRELPDYPRVIAYEGGAGETRFTIDGLEPGTPYWFRIVARENQDSMVSGDFSFWTE